MGNTGFSYTCCLFTHILANSEVCPHLVSELQDLLLDYPHSFEFHLAKFGAPREAVDAILEVKKCIDQISISERTTLFMILVLFPLLHSKHSDQQFR